MAKKKSQPWDEVFDRVCCAWQPDKVYPPKATGAELDAVETELGFQFPTSYRAFAERFGLGGSLKVAPGLHIAITILSLWPPENQHWASVVGRTGVTRGDCGNPDDLPLLYRRSAPRPSPLCGGQHEVPRGVRLTAEFGNVVAFAGDDDEGLGSFVFQPAEPTDPALGECRVFAFNSARVIRPVASSFWEWLQWVEANYQFQPTDEYDEDQGEPNTKPTPILKPNPRGALRQYERDWLCDKKAPAKKHIATWLSFNHNAARDLALAIRDHGQTDAFPILADALQEAGCTNADLLDSCRHCDPDIDGVWVLQVLLGESQSQ